MIGADSGWIPAKPESAPSIGIIRTGTKGISQPDDLVKYPRKTP